MLKVYVEYLRTFFRDEEGASAVEYGLIVGLIAVVLIAVLIAVGGADDNSGLRGLFSEVADEVNSAGGGGGTP
ncbi:MAG: Flp family type IVb pilin [Sinimarinibacterium flocculans]|uniref:Flp family type IVb pilin n=1 Tax=Sinimarinibacterium flocculans TaxID=985250 RepID=UPI003515ECA8